ncbi:MAG: tartrate dehydrogenase [Hoeflea sp.]|uniref:tartrate dehydrogenase n=1 Tax=Hoeflea sp. TaxID=1940281 RepID=UPI001D268783|nr:tartrate dehydrogenase [Hoeflea sp.]MBU4530345.1 tartrate dehydrogenase [Alphaproteobacteria bacterium]MBU4545132.1 tartrate dehydrogenase [Alphaproteobacteria bacterium]MBU4549668.1 tartrate dehydrogenase [Alphaproteobacteria bacterium]MBV1721935.1 tartrate dehydrogenase [Hoeflea sp.]MBV1761285.1 tartrate dehydrogenase [Hoeflea sp.]
MRRHRIAAIGGDGVGPEVISAGLEVITALSAKLGDFQIEAQSFDWGSELYRNTGVMMPADGADRLRGFDAIFFGAVGAPDIADHITLWELRLAICQGLDQYANVRPTKLLPGMRGPLMPELGAQIDWVIVRENSEGEYAGVGGRAHAALSLELAMDVSVFTRAGIERIARYACELAMKRPRKRLTVVTKSNAQRHGMVLWDQVCREVLIDYPELETDFMLVDAMAAKMVTSPGTYDTILATNLHADILSDLASALTGSLGNGATANLNPSGDAPSMFEPIHGSAFDITGKGIANPIGAFWTAAMMLDHLGERQAADVLMEAIGSVCQSGPHTPDMGGQASTAAVTQAVIQAISELGMG